MYDRPIVEVKNGEIKFNLFPKQAAFVHSEVDDVFYGGSVGGGKTAALLAWAAIRRLQYPNSNGVLFRRTFRELEGSLILKSKEIYRLLGATYNENKKCWTFANGATQFFAFCESDGDVYMHQTNEYQDMGFDEVTHFTQFQFNYLAGTRTRSTIPGMKVQIRSASNPGNIGNDWVRKRYINPSKVSGIWKDEETGKTLSFIPAWLSDNPALTENDPGYRDRLKDLKRVSEKKYLALAEGRWDQPEGVYFTEWSHEPGQHVLAYRRVPDSHTIKFLSLDWGFSEPACVLWWEVTPMGRVFIYREYYGTRLSPKELAEKILSMCPESEKYMYMAASPEIWGKRVETDNGGEVIQQLIQAGLGDRVMMQKANNARIPGWLKMREYMAKAPDGRPWMQISPNCENLVRTLPSLVHDERLMHTEDVSGKCEDHGPEACLEGGSTVITKEHGEVTLNVLAAIADTGHILTHYGWRKYSNCRLTRKSAAIYSAHFLPERFVTATPDHEFLTINRGFVRMDELDQADEIMSIAGGPMRFLSKIPMGTADVYNLEVEGAECFAVNRGPIVHNCRYGITSLSFVPKPMVTPYMTGYEKIFGQQRDANENFAYLPDHGEGRGGYGNR